MHDIYVSDIKKICNAKIYGDENIVLDNFCTDTRVLEKDNIYVGLKGEKINGSDFYQEACEKGAKVLILDKYVEVPNNITLVIVDDTLDCLQKLASYKRDLYDIPVIAITGSSGKTSTKDIVASVVSTKYKTHKTIGNYNNHIGVPLTILSLKDENALVIEMGMNHLGEISLLSKIAKPTISIITNVGTAHIGILGSRDNILKAKLEILDGMIGNNVIINLDNDLLNNTYNELNKKYKVTGISIDNDSDYKATNIKYDVFSNTFDIDNETININVGGKVFVYNALVAYAIGKILNIETNDIKLGINNFKLSSGRLEKKVTKNGMIIIDDTYNANYDSMKSSIELLSHVKDKRKVVILGDMLELGEYSEEMHKKIGECVKENNIDLVITIGNYSKLINDISSINSIENYHFDKEYESYSTLDKILEKNDCVLIKGSHSINLKNIVDYLVK